MTPQASESNSLLAAKGSAHPAALPGWDDALSTATADDRPAFAALSAPPHTMAAADAASASVVSADLSAAQAAPLLPSHIFRSKRTGSLAEMARAEPLGSPDPIDEPEPAPTEADSPGSTDAMPSDSDPARKAVEEPLQPIGHALPGAPETVDGDADQTPTEAIEPESVDGTQPPHLANSLESTVGKAADSPALEADTDPAAATGLDGPGRDSDPPAAPAPDPEPAPAKVSSPGAVSSKQAGDLKAPLGSAATPSLSGVRPGAVPTGRPVKRDLGRVGTSSFRETGKSAGKRDLWVIVALVLLGIAAVSLIAWSIHDDLISDEAAQTHGEGSLGSATPSTEPQAPAPPRSSSATELAVGSGGYLPSEGPSLESKLDTAAVSAPPAAKAGAKAAPQPKVDLVRIEASGEAIIAGVAAPHSELIVLDKGQPIGTVTVDSRGEWVLLPETPLAEGDHEISLVMKIVSDSVKLPRLD